MADNINNHNECSLTCVHFSRCMTWHRPAIDLSHFDIDIDFSICSNRMADLESAFKRHALAHIFSIESV